MAMTLGMFHAPQPAVLRAGRRRSTPSSRGSRRAVRPPRHVAPPAAPGRRRGAPPRAAGGGRAARRAAAAAGALPPQGAHAAAGGLQHGLSPRRPSSASSGGGARRAISLTSAEALKPSAVAITGPLIRIVGDRFPWGVKAAILHTLRLLIEKGASPQAVRPAAPDHLRQGALRRDEAVPQRGAAALHKLAALSTRVEPLLVELGGALLAAEAGVQHALLSAIAGVLRGMPKAVGEGTLQTLQHSATELLTVDDDGVALAAAATLGSLELWLPLPPLLAAIEAAADGDESGEAWRGSSRSSAPTSRCCARSSPPPSPTACRRCSPSRSRRLERSELRQPAARSLARIAAAMAEPSPADGDAAAGGDEAADEALAEAAAAAVPESVPAALALLGDRVVEVRCSALHALKRLYRLRPALVRARRCALPKAMLGAVAAACADKRSASPPTAAAGDARARARVRLDRRRARARRIGRHRARRLRRRLRAPPPEAAARDGFGGRLGWRWGLKRFSYARRLRPQLREPRRKPGLTLSVATDGNKLLRR